jgi:hypothetical protein
MPPLMAAAVASAACGAAAARSRVMSCDVPNAGTGRGDACGMNACCCCLWRPPTHTHTHTCCTASDRLSGSTSSSLQTCCQTQLWGERVLARHPPRTTRRSAHLGPSSTGSCSALPLSTSNCELEEEALQLMTAIRCAAGVLLPLSLCCPALPRACGCTAATGARGHGH